MPTNPSPKTILIFGGHLNAYIGDRLYVSAPASLGHVLPVKELVAEGWKYVYPRILRGEELLT
ncbi:MAG: hypothetical protein MH252_08345 [Thermosynechococcaceae cyanobacterium MS004]|nr:hypothetical protein [Thermosynechococcaceae cyanobacterium MS004]